MLSANDIWSNTVNRTEERKLIHQFWLELSEDERKSLILIEKEAVINKIKDQQKNSCNCSICGKTRHSVEYELEALYDMYFKELEKYSYGQRQKQIMELDSDPDDGDEDEEDEDDDESDTDEPNLELSARTVKQDVFPVSDKNAKKDGQKLLSMMHKFAEKKRLREHQALIEDSDDPQEDEEDESDGEGKTEDEKRQDALKMFTVFAARMFEQRVLAAYREKVAHDRQKRLIEELEEEDRKKQEKELKKQKEKEEKKNKKRLLKLQQEREREEEEERKRQEEVALKQKQEEERQLREQERIRREQEKQKKLQKENERRQKRLKEKEAERKRKEEEKLMMKKKKLEETTTTTVTNESEPNVQHHALTDESNISSTVNLTRQLPKAGPISPPTSKRECITSLNCEYHQQSFFSKHLFDQPTNKRTLASEEFTTTPKRPSTLVWTNGWTQLNKISDGIHIKLFGDVIKSRHAMIIERTRVAYMTLDRMSTQKPPFHSLSQIHRTINETYKDEIIVGIREIYEAITKYPLQEFECVMSEEQGYVVLYNPPTQNEKLFIPTQYPSF